MRGIGALVGLMMVGCGAEAPAPPAAEARRDEAVDEPAVDEPAVDEPAPAEGPSCEDRARAAREEVDAALEAHLACTFDVECVAVPIESGCETRCPAAIHPAGSAPLEEAIAAVATRCEAFVADGCAGAHRQCAPATPRCVEGRCAMGDGDPPLREVPIPEANRAGQDPPPPRPPPGEVETERARRLLRAIAQDDPSIAQDFFFPREAFARVKAIADPDAYWHRLFARYAADIHALHEALGDLEGAELVALDVIRRGGWVPRGEEANALPYWVSRHSRLRYRVGGEERSFEVRVLITWGERWYVTHLSEFH